MFRHIDHYVLKSSRGMDEPSTLRSGWYCKHSGGTDEKWDGLPLETVMHHELQPCVSSFANQHGMIGQLEKMKQQQSCVQHRLAQSNVEVVKKMRYWNFYEQTKSLCDVMRLWVEEQQIEKLWS